MQVIIKNYDHYNRAIGKHIRSKDHYDYEMKSNNYITHEEAIERSKNNGNKEYVLSQNGWDIINSAKNSKDSKGRVKLSDRTIDAMKKIGAVGKKIPDYMKLPSHYNQEQTP